MSFELKTTLTLLTVVSILALIAIHETFKGLSEPAHDGPFFQENPENANF